MYLKFLLLFFLIALTSCSSVKPKPVSDSRSMEKIQDLEALLNHAESEATPEGKAVLKTSRKMISKKEIIRGSCWDYINAVYNRAGYTPDKRVTALKSKMIGPFADISLIRPGDWLYFINHSYREVDHSGVFVEWMNKEKKTAVIMSYIGGKKRAPGSYKIYDLKNVYYIIRPK